MPQIEQGVLCELWLSLSGLAYLDRVRHAAPLGTAVQGDRASSSAHFLLLQNSTHFSHPAENLPTVGGLNENIYLPQTVLQLPLPKSRGQDDSE